MKIKIHIILSLFLVAITSCIKEDYFGYSTSAEIIEIQLSNQSGNTQIFTDNDSIYIQLANGVDLSKIVLNKLELSSFANANINEGDTLNLETNFIEIPVTSESGTIKNWQLHVFEIGSNPQIENSNFNTWYQKGSYLEIGADDTSSAWGTSNPGAVFGGMDPNVQQYEIAPEDYAAKLTTRFTLIGSFVNKPIAAGSLFTGDFMEGDISFDDPEASINFGIPFTATPSAFQLDYKYTPGTTNIDANQNELNFPDTGDVYVLLERRDDTTVQRVATAWYRIASETPTMQTLEVDFIYGELPANTPSYMLPASNEMYALPDTPPTHIKVVFSSSAYGNLFQGAENSELIVDNFKLLY